MTFVSRVFLVLVVPVVVSYGHGEHLFNPCQNYRHGDHKYLFPDPLDCSKFYSCDAGRTPHHMDCPQGTSFDDTWGNGYGSCTGPDPRFVRDCYSNDRGDDDGDDDDDDCDDHYDDNRCDVKSKFAKKNRQIEVISALLLPECKQTLTNSIKIFQVTTISGHPGVLAR